MAKKVKSACCKKEVDSATTLFKRKHREEIYCFCPQECKTKFELTWHTWYRLTKKEGGMAEEEITKGKLWLGMAFVLAAGLLVGYLAHSGTIPKKVLN